MTWRSCQASPALPVWESTVPSVLPRMSLAGQRDLEVLQLHPGDNSPAGLKLGQSSPGPRSCPKPRPRYAQTIPGPSVYLLPYSCGLDLAPAIKPSTPTLARPHQSDFLLLWGHGGAAHWEGPFWGLVSQYTDSGPSAASPHRGHTSITDNILQNGVSVLSPQRHEGLYTRPRVFTLDSLQGLRAVF